MTTYLVMMISIARLIKRVEREKLERGNTLKNTRKERPKGEKNQYVNHAKNKTIKIMLGYIIFIAEILSIQVKP